MIALKRVTHYLKGTRHFVNKLELDTDDDKHVTRLDGFSDSDWAGSTDRNSQSSGVLFVDTYPSFFPSPQKLHAHKKACNPHKKTDTKSKRLMFRHGAESTEEATVFVDDWTSLSQGCCWRIDSQAMPSKWTAPWNG